MFKPKVTYKRRADTARTRGVQGVKPRNFILISFDDAVAFWKYKSVFGQVLRTPNLDAICGQSTAFHAAYTQAPVCNPSRAAFMSGLTPHQSGITTPNKEVFDAIPPEGFLPAYLKEQGYYTSSGGKGILGYNDVPSPHRGFLYSDRRKQFNKDWHLPADVPTEARREYGGIRGGQATATRRYDRSFHDYQATNSAIDFLKRRPADQPFFREVGFYSPHGPWITPARFKEMYDPDRFVKPTAWAKGFPRNPYFESHFGTNFPEDGPPENWRKAVRNYFSALSHVDHHLGRLWAALKASAHADNTVVIITSDHGHHLGDHNRFRKHTLFEQACNVPLIIHDPDQPAPQVVTDPVALIDIVPTVLDYANLPSMPGRVGRSLRPQMQLAPDPGRAVPTFLRNNSGIRKGRYRYIHYEDGQTQLFDLATDWWQMSDLGPAHPAYDEMRQAHHETCLEYGHDPSGVVPIPAHPQEASAN